MFVPASGSVKSGIYRVCEGVNFCKVKIVAVNLQGEVLTCSQTAEIFRTPLAFKEAVVAQLYRMQKVVDNLRHIIAMGSRQSFGGRSVRVTMTFLSQKRIDWKYSFCNEDNEYGCSIGIYDDLFVNLVDENGLNTAGKEWVIDKSFSDPNRISPPRDMTAFQEYMNSLPVYDDTVERFIEATWQPWVREQLKK